MSTNCTVPRTLKLMIRQPERSNIKIQQLLWFIPGSKYSGYVQNQVQNIQAMFRGEGINKVVVQTVT